MRHCYKCGIEEEKAEFKDDTTSICKKCYVLYMKEYRKKNKDKLSKQIQGWKDNNREKYKESNRKHYHTPGGKSKHVARVENTPRTWLSHILSALKTHSKKPSPHDPKSGPQRDFDLDLDYVVGLFVSQGRRCAITGLEMEYKFGSLFSISIDRIDSSKGHVRGNVQLVCQCVNKLKGKHSQGEVLGFFDRLRDLWLGGIMT